MQRQRGGLSTWGAPLLRRRGGGGGMPCALSARCRGLSSDASGHSSGSHLQGYHVYGIAAPSIAGGHQRSWQRRVSTGFVVRLRICPDPRRGAGSSAALLARIWFRSGSLVCALVRHRSVGALCRRPLRRWIVLLGAHIPWAWCACKRVCPVSCPLEAPWRSGLA